MLVSALLILATSGVSSAAPLTTPPTARISGDGSSWAGNALMDWVAAIKTQGVTVDYTPDGSALGRHNFALGLSDFAVSEVPYGLDPQDTTQPTFGYGLVPVTAGGLAFMYNVPVGGAMYARLRLSQLALAKIFAGEVTQWNDPIIAATNPGVALPDQRITVVVRSDGSGSTYVLTSWLKDEYPADYAALCGTTGCDASHPTSYFPYTGLSNFTAQSGADGVTTYTANTPYTINFDEYASVVAAGFPAAQIQNSAGNWASPDDARVWRALRHATVTADGTVDLASVFGSTDPNAYPLSYLAYAFIPTTASGPASMNTGKRETLAYFLTFALCEGQRTMGALGYSPLPLKLVQAGFAQIAKLGTADPSADLTGDNITNCSNPTFNADTLAETPPPLPSVTVHRPTISGLPKVGHVLSASTPSPVYIGYAYAAQGPVTYTYSWNADDRPIPGATKTIYVPTVTDAHKFISVTITPHEYGLASVPATSAHVGAIVPSPIAVRQPTIKVTRAPTTTMRGSAVVAVRPAVGSATITGPTRAVLTFTRGTRTITRSITLTFRNGIATCRLPRLPVRGRWAATLKLVRSDLIKRPVVSRTFAVRVGR